MPRPIVARAVRPPSPRSRLSVRSPFYTYFSTFPPFHRLRPQPVLVSVSVPVSVSVSVPVSVPVSVSVPVPVPVPSNVLVVISGSGRRRNRGRPTSCRTFSVRPGRKKRANRRGRLAKCFWPARCQSPVHLRTNKYNRVRAETRRSVSQPASRSIGTRVLAEFIFYTRRVPVVAFKLASRISRTSTYVYRVRPVRLFSFAFDRQSAVAFARFTRSLIRANDDGPPTRNTV